MGARFNVFTLGVILAAIFSHLYQTTGRSLLSGVVLFTLGCGAAMLLRISAQTCSKYTSAKELVILYLAGLVFKIIGAYRSRQFDKATKNPSLTQEETLLDILRKNAKTEYGLKMGLGTVTNVAEFQACHPLSNYEQFQDYIDRTAKGEDNVLLPTRPVQMAKSSGTTGKPKMIPLSKERKLDLGLTGIPLLQSFMRQYSPNSVPTTQKMCSVYTHEVEDWTEGGIVFAGVSRRTATDITPIESSPHAAFRIHSEVEAMYVHAVFALRDNTLKALQAPFCVFICEFFRQMEINWRDIVDDIGRGSIKADLDIPSDIRSELYKALVPDPIRAEELRREFELGFDGFATRVWPSLSCIFAAVSLSTQIQADKIEKSYAKGVILHSAFYIASEGFLGINIWPMKREHKYHYVLMNDLNFYEFIPLQNSDEDQPHTRIIGEVVEGESYELVITNSDGLYRYRLGDVVKIAGFYNKTPIIEVQFRKGELMNLKTEKTSADCIFRALTDTITAMDAELTDYACADSQLVEMVKGSTLSEEQQPYYVIFAEVKDKTGCRQGPSEESIKFDDILRKQAGVYNDKRSIGSIGPACLIFVRPDSFRALRAFIIDNSSTSPLQFKTPRKLRKKEWVELLLKASY